MRIRRKCSKDKTGSKIERYKEKFVNGSKRGQ